MRVIDGGIYERDDELFIVEKVYEAKQALVDRAPITVTLVKVRCIDPMPGHVDLDTFLEKWQPYDPEAA